MEHLPSSQNQTAGRSYLMPRTPGILSHLQRQAVEECSCIPAWIDSLPSAPFPSSLPPPSSPLFPLFLSLSLHYHLPWSLKQYLGPWSSSWLHIGITWEIKETTDTRVPFSEIPVFTALGCELGFESVQRSSGDSPVQPSLRTSASGYLLSESQRNTPKLWRRSWILPRLPNMPALWDKCLVLACPF